MFLLEPQTTEAFLVHEPGERRRQPGEVRTCIKRGCRLACFHLLKNMCFYRGSITTFGSFLSFFFFFLGGGGLKQTKHGDQQKAMSKFAGSNVWAFAGSSGRCGSVMFLLFVWFSLG